MKICLVQFKPDKGNIAANITRHQAFIHTAVDNGAGTVIFPELSLTGYEPTLARELATTITDSRLSVFQTLSDTHRATIAVGIPLQTETGITISLLFFQPLHAPVVYSKQYLHPDEEPFFVAGKSHFTQMGGQPALAPAICYELFVPAHSDAAHRHGATVYAASVAKAEKGVAAAMQRLPLIAQQYGFTVLMANCIGVNDGMICAGQSAVWNSSGQLLGQLNSHSEGLLCYNTQSGEVTRQYV